MWRVRYQAVKIVLPVLLISAVSCRPSEDARIAATHMATTAKDLDSYYSALESVVDDQAKLERLQKALLGVPLDPQDLSQLQSIHAEMEKRVATAKALAKLADSFIELTGSKAPADVSQAAASLGAKLSDIQQLPGASYAPEALQSAGKILTQFALQHDERKMAESIDPTMAALSQMFTQEKPAYDSMNTTYIGLAQSLALELVKRNQVDPENLLAPALKPFGLTSHVPPQQVTQQLQEYAREQIQSEGKQELAAYAKASAEMDDALKELSTEIHQLATTGHSPAKKTALKLSAVELWTKQLQ